MKSKSILAVICAAAMAMSFSGCRLLDNNQGDYSSNTASSIMSSSGQTTESVPNSSETGEICTVTIHIKFVPNLIFSKYDVDLYIDEVKQETLKHGEDADFEFKLLSGEHTIMFANHDDSSVSGSMSFNVIDDIETAYKISCHYDGVDVEVDNGETTNESSVISSEQFETSTASVPEQSVPSVSEPEIVSTPTVTDDIITVANCSELQNLIFLDQQSNGSEIKAFAEKYKGKTMEIEMLTTFVEHNGNYKTRFNYLLYAVQDGSAMLMGPAFMFENVNYYDLHLTGENIPDSFGTGIHCRVKAKIKGYDSTNQWTLLDPISIEVIKVY